MFNRYLNNVSALQLFQLIKYGAVFLTGIVLVKSGVETPAIGQYEILLFLAGAITWFWVNGIIRGFLSLAEKNKKPSAFFNLFFLLLLFAVISGGALSVLKQALISVFPRIEGFRYFNFLLLYLFASAPANITEYVYLVKERNRQLVLYGMIAFGLQFALVALPALLGMDIEYSVAGLVLAAFMRLLWSGCLVAKHSVFNLDFEFIQRCLVVAWPLIAAALLGGAAKYIDGFIVTSFFGDADFAIFRYGARELPLAFLLANAFSNALVSEIGSGGMTAEVLKKIKNGGKRLSNLLFPVSVVLMLVAHEAFVLLFSNEFEAGATIFNVYLLLLISRVLFPQTILTGLGKTRWIMKASFYELVINVTLSLWFVRFWGLAGIAFATVIAYCFGKIYLAIVVFRKAKVHPQQYLNIRQWGIYALLLVIVFCIVELVIY